MVRLGQSMLGNRFYRRRVVKQTMTKMTCDLGQFLHTFLNSWHRVEIALIIVLDSLLAQTLKKLKKPEDLVKWLGQVSLCQVVHFTE